MIQKKLSRIGFTCSYTPLPLIDAAGFTPYRILPMGESPDRAGEVLHDNLCPHVKRVLDRVIYNDVPELEGVILLNSCDAMRRLADAWRNVRPNDRVILIDLPFATDDSAVDYFTQELSRLADTLAQWSGRPVSFEAIHQSVDQYNQLADCFGSLRKRFRNGGSGNHAAILQNLCNMAVTDPVPQTYQALQRVMGEANAPINGDKGIPIFLFGNVLPDPEAMELFELCGARIADEDLCTGSRIFAPIDIDSDNDVFMQMARSILRRPRCARTLDLGVPGVIASEVISRATACGARGVIACTAKFCDPYLARIPGVREALRSTGLPLLHIEGDCTMRSFGQQRTRIEAFVEMLRS